MGTRIMSDPTVRALKTKVLCKHGGRLPRDLLPIYWELPPKKVKKILQNEPQKFLEVGKMVLARSPVRICDKYLKNEAEQQCDKLHLCRNYLRGKCWPGRRPPCLFSHDILSHQNRKVLKANEISGLNEDEIKVLLLQNDNQLLPEVCVKYLHDSCDLGKDCSWLHICGYFTRGECNRRFCKFSHHLLELGSDLLLTRCRMSEETVENFQMICTAKHEEHLKTKGKKDQKKGQAGGQRGRGRSRNRKNGEPQEGTRSKSRGQRQGREGFHSQGRSDSCPVSESGESHPCSGEDDDDSDEALKTRILNDWFNSPPGKSSDRGTSLPKMVTRYPSSVQPLVPSGTHHPTPTVYTSYVEDSWADHQSTLPMTSPKVSPQPGLPSAPQPKPISVGPVNTPSTSSAGPYKPIHLPTRGPSIAESVKLVSPTVVNPSTASVPFTRPSRLVDLPMKSPFVPQEKPVTPTSSSYSAQPVVTTIKPVSFSATSPSSAQSTSYVRLGDSPALGPSVQWVKPAQPQSSPAPSYADPDKVPVICLSNIWKYCKLGACCPEMHYNLPYRWQIYKGTDWEDISYMEEIEKCYCDPKVDRVESVDFVTMRSGVHRIRRLSTVSSVTKPSAYVLTTEWLWYWKDENGDWIQYGHYNVKQVSSTILSSDLENIYLSDPTDVHTFTVGIQHYEINFREMKEKKVLYKTEKDVRRRPKYLSCENVKLLRGSTASPTPQSTPAAAMSPLKSAPSPLKSAPSPLKSAPSPLKSAPSPLKTDIYPSTWDASGLPEIGCTRVLIPETSSEFSEIVSSFTKTVSGHVVNKLWRLQNPSLWKKFQCQKEEMKKVNQGQDVKEMRLFHGAVPSHVHIIYNENFNWHICGFHGFGYGQGNYFARDALYADNYSVPQPDGKQSMFVARVLVGDYAMGNQQMTQPPQRPGSTTLFDSCVDNVLNPSIFVVFEKHQVYPEYLLEYKKLKKPCVIC